MKTTGIILLALLSGCSSSSGDDDPPVPAQCRLEDRVGTYRITYTKQSGSCPEIDPQIVSFNPGPMGAGTGCTINSERLSEGNCKLERDLTCDTPPAGTIRSVLVTRQMTQDASVLEGVGTFQLSPPNACTGTYGVRAVRQ